MSVAAIRQHLADCAGQAAGMDEWEVGHIIAGGAFGLSASDTLYDCRDYTLTLMEDEIESSALREVVPALFYALSEDN